MNAVKKPEWPFYGAWIIFSALCVPAAFVLYYLVIQIINDVVGDYIFIDGVRHITEDYLFGYIFVPAAGLLTGLVQYGLLRRVLPGMGWWIPATAAGWFIGLLLIFGLGEFVVRVWSIETYFAGNWAVDASFILLGLSIGFFQWLVLRRSLARAAWWIVANVLGYWLIGLLVGGSLGMFTVLAITVLPSGVTAVTLAVLFNLESRAELQHV